MKPFKEAHDTFTESDTFKGLSDPTTINAPASQRQFLENRLIRAFQAGWKAAVAADKKE